MLLVFFRWKLTPRSNDENTCLGNGWLLAEDEKVHFYTHQLKSRWIKPERKRYDCFEANSRFKQNIRIKHLIKRPVGTVKRNGWSASSQFVAVPSQVGIPNRNYNYCWDFFTRPNVHFQNSCLVCFSSMAEASFLTSLVSGGLVRMWTGFTQQTDD